MSASCKPSFYGPPRKQFQRVAGTETLTADARIVAASHQDLERLVAEGRFRRDLYYRLNVTPSPFRRYASAGGISEH